LYYHEQCLPADQRAKLKLDSTTSAKLGSSSPATPELVNVALAADLARQDARESVKKELVYETRGELREELRRHRLRLAKQKNQAPYMIFYDQTLDDIVAKLPVNDRELMRCWGIAKKKCDELIWKFDH
jgi:superfamily II DNA helicase RecQ